MRDKKLNISLVFAPQCYFKVPEDIGLNATLFYLENAQQIRTPANGIKSFV